MIKANIIRAGRRPHLKCLAALAGILLSRLLQAADWQLADEQFARCVAELAASKHWQVAAEVLDISCHSQNIASIKGINQFTQLRSLSLHNNHLSQADLAGLTKLENLNLANNILVELKLTNLPALQMLMVFNNQLLSLQLNNLPQLKTLKANANKLVQFTYVGLPALEKIVMFDNKLPTIDITHLPALKIMDVRQNPMPKTLYDDMNKMAGVTFMHDGNAPDWQ